MALVWASARKYCIVWICFEKGISLDDLFIRNTLYWALSFERCLLSRIYSMLYDRHFKSRTDRHLKSRTEYKVMHCMLSHLTPWETWRVATRMWRHWTLGTVFWKFSTALQSENIQQITTERFAHFSNDLGIVRAVLHLFALGLRNGSCMWRLKKHFQITKGIQYMNQNLGVKPQEAVIC